MSKQDIAKRFKRDTAHHQMTVLHDDGLYRHLRFADANPDPEKRMAWNLWFDLITVPGVLIFRGDGESFVFSRLEDMFEFFRGGGYDRTPNYHYWAKKLTSTRNVKKYDEDLMASQVKELVKEFIDEHALEPEQAAEKPRDFVPVLVAKRSNIGDRLREEVRNEVLDALCGDPSLDRQTVDQFEFYINDQDRYGYPKKRPDFTFGETWEWDVEDYDWWYQWACHAIVWGIAQYDATKTAH